MDYSKLANVADSLVNDMAHYTFIARTKDRSSRRVEVDARTRTEAESLAFEQAPNSNLELVSRTASKPGALPEKHRTPAQSDTFLEDLTSLLDYYKIVKLDKGHVSNGAEGNIKATVVAALLLGGRPYITVRAYDGTDVDVLASKFFGGLQGSDVVTSYKGYPIRFTAAQRDQVRKQFENIIKDNPIPADGQDIHHCAHCGTEMPPSDVEEFGTLCESCYTKEYVEDSTKETSPVKDAKERKEEDGVILKADKDDIDNAVNLNKENFIAQLAAKLYPLVIEPSKLNRAQDKRFSFTIGEEDRASVNTIRLKFSDKPQPKVEEFYINGTLVCSPNQIGITALKTCIRSTQEAEDKGNISINRPGKRTLSTDIEELSTTNGFFSQLGFKKGTKVTAQAKPVMTTRSFNKAKEDGRFGSKLNSYKEYDGFFASIPVVDFRTIQVRWKDKDEEPHIITESEYNKLFAPKSEDDYNIAASLMARTPELEPLAEWWENFKEGSSICAPIGNKIIYWTIRNNKTVKTEVK